jgi:hypothetical protein
VIRLAAFLALVVGLTLAAYLAAVAIAFRMLGGGDAPDDEPGGGWGL